MLLCPGQQHPSHQPKWQHKPSRTDSEHQVLGCSAPLSLHNPRPKPATTPVNAQSPPPVQHIWDAATEHLSYPKCQHSQAQSWGLSIPPSTSDEVSVHSSGPFHTQTEQAVAASKPLQHLEDSRLQPELCGVAAARSQKTRSHLLQGRTARSTVAHMCLSHVKAPSLFNISEFECVQPPEWMFLPSR